MTNGDPTVLRMVEEPLEGVGYAARTRALVDEPLPEIVRLRPARLIIDVPSQVQPRGRCSPSSTPPRPRN